MPWNYAKAADRTARMQVGVDSMDSGSSNGTLELGDSGFSTVIAIFDLNDPSAVVSGNTLTFSGLPKTVAAAATGTIAEARTKDSNGDIVFDKFTAGTSGTDVIVDNTSATAGQDVTWNSGVLTHATPS